MTTADAAPPRRPEEAAGSSQSIGDLISAVSQDMSTLMRQELQLARAEVRQEARTAGRAAGMFAGAGVAAHLVLVFLSLALWRLLTVWIDAGWSAVIVAAVWAVIGGVFYRSGRARIRELRGMPQTVETVKRVPQTLKPSTMEGDQP